MMARRWLGGTAVTVAVVLAAPAFAHQPLPGPEDLIRRFEPAEIEVPEPAFGAGRTLPFTVRAHAYGRDFLLALRPSKVAIGWPNVFEGTVAGESDSRVAVTIEGGVLDGLARIGSEIYFFEPARRFDPDAAARATVAYRLSDISQRVPGSSLLRDRLRRRLERGRVGGSAAAAQVAGTFPARLDVALVADFEYSSRFGNGTEARMVTILNMVNAIYLDQLNLRFRMIHQEVFRTASDPFSDFNSSNLFSNFKNAATEFGSWRSRQSGPARTAGLAHLFSNRSLGLTSGGAGFGFINVLCSASKGVGISTTPGFDSTGLQALIIEHEFGHNFGAPHDGEGSCAGAPAGHIMAPSATGTTFSDCSKGIMTAKAEAASCVTKNVAITTTTSSTTTTTMSAPACAQPLTTGPAPTATD
ncbi:MAG: hypothetical protein D6760_10565, partial [Deltaproteobacteria bacterium]